MAHEDLRSAKIEDLLNQVQGLQAVGDAGQVQSVMALLARLTIEMSGSLHEVRAGLFDVKKALAERLDALTAQLDTSAAQASRQAAAITFWTRVQVGVAIAYTVITGGLLVVAFLTLRAHP